MKLERCKNGHFYDGDKYSTCPHCSNGQNTVDHGDTTVPLGNKPDAGLQIFPHDFDDLETTIPGSFYSNGGGISDDGLTIPMGDEETDEGKTIFIDLFDEKTGSKVSPMQVTPCVGWLVCIDGKHKGQDFRLVPGKNSIGRNERNKVALIGDDSVSRDCQAMVVYDYKSNMYYATQGSSSTLCYLNGQVLLTQMVLQAYDVLEVGKCKLLFVPLCGEKFNWTKL